MVFVRDLNKSGRLLSAQGLTLARLPCLVLPDLIGEGKDRTRSLPARIFGVMPFSPSLLVPVKGFRRGVHAHEDLLIFETALLPPTLPQNDHELENRMSLIDPEAIHITPEGTGGWLAGQLKKPTLDGIQSDIDKMPQSIESDKQKDQNPQNHQVVAQFWLFRRHPADLRKKLLQPNQVRKFDQGQKAAKRPPNGLSRSRQVS
jgi:hypothetical protein